MKRRYCEREKASLLAGLRMHLCEAPGPWEPLVCTSPAHAYEWGLVEHLYRSHRKGEHGAGDRYESPASSKPHAGLRSREGACLLCPSWIL